MTPKSGLGPLQILQLWGSGLTIMNMQPIQLCNVRYGVEVGLAGVDKRSRRNSFWTRSMTVDQSPAIFWRKRRAVGYHGLSSRSRSQRQSGLRVSKIQTGLPSAPARCATAVSTVMTRSRLAIAAAGSAEALRLVERSMRLRSIGISSNSFAAGPFCNEYKIAPGSSLRAQS